MSEVTGTQRVDTDVPSIPISSEATLPSVPLSEEQISLLQKSPHKLGNLAVTTRKILARIKAIVLENNLPQSIEVVSRIGELVQLTQDQVVANPSVGISNVWKIGARLSEDDLGFGMQFTESQLASTSCRKVRGLTQYDRRGEIPELLFGEHALALGAKVILHSKLSEVVPEIDLKGLASFSVRTEGGMNRQLTSVGDLIQLPYSAVKDTFSFAPLLNFLMPRGLCMGMALSDAKLSELGLERLTLVIRDTENSFSATTPDIRTNSIPIEQPKQLVAKEEDLQAIEEALKYVWRPELDFIFQERSRIENTLVITFDDTTAFVFRRENGHYKRYSFPLQCETNEFSHDWWAAGSVVHGLETCLPNEWFSATDVPRFISGALLTPFIENQKKRDREFNPYITRESYLATIVHEFGHIYFNSFIDRTDHIYSDRIKPDHTITLMRNALALYNKQPVEHPAEIAITRSERISSEVFAFCTDRAASSIFWPNHLADVDRSNAAALLRLIQLESETNPQGNWGDSLFSYPHIAAMTIGPLFMAQYGEKWPKAILQWGMGWQDY